jgi:CP family cyanate transporter-like MFS transporter
MSGVAALERGPASDAPGGPPGAGRTEARPLRAGRRRLLACGIVLVALNLRTTVTSLPALAPQIERDAAISSATVGLLTSLPALCMALLGPPAHRLAARWSREATTMAAIACVAAGNGLRLAGARPAALFAATSLAGVGVAACGVMLPGLVKAAFPRRPGAATGAVAVAMLLGAAAAGALAAPLARLLGSWEGSLAAWAVPAAPAVLLWTSIVARGGGRDAHARTPSAPLPWRAPAAWLLGAFFALQAALGYGYLAWIAPAYEARGWSSAAAGGLLGVLNLAQLASALVLPALTDRGRDRRPGLLVAVALTVTGAVWLFALPGAAPWLATVALGLGLGGGFSLTLVLIVDVAADPVASTGLAAMVFLVGYVAAALAPMLVGALHDGFGGFRAPFGVLACVALGQLATATRLGPRHRGAVASPTAART